MPGSGSLQAGQLTVWLASACALQIMWVALVRHLSWQLIRPVLVLGCLSSRGPLGLALGFYRELVRRLDITHSNCKGELGQPNMAGEHSCHAPPASPESSPNMVRWHQTCRTLCGIVTLGLHSFAGLKSRSRVSGGGGTKGKEENETIFRATACSLSALGMINFCSPQAELAPQNRRPDRCEWCPDWAKG